MLALLDLHRLLILAPRTAGALRFVFAAKADLGWREIVPTLLCAAGGQEKIGFWTDMVPDPRWGCPSGTVTKRRAVRPSTAVAMHSGEPWQLLSYAALAAWASRIGPLGSLYVGEPTAFVCSPPHPHVSYRWCGGLRYST